MIFSYFENFDKYLFLKINTVWTSPVLDAILPWWRDKNTWIPLYIFLALFAFINFGKKALPWFLFVLATVAIMDQLSSHFLKEYFDRVRPCNDVVMRLKERFLVRHRPQSGSFPSSHASNHFALALFFFLTLRRYFGKWVWLFIFWAATICYGQIYVGVHYPTDIIGGALLGSAVGTGMYFLFNRFFKMPVVPAPLSDGQLKKTHLADAQKDRVEDQTELPAIAPAKTLPKTTRL